MRLIPPAFSWDSQARQYAFKDTPGIGYERHHVGLLSDSDYHEIDCLLWRDEKGILRGILNHYPTDSYWEDAGNVNVWVHPKWQRRGIATELIAEAQRRWEIDPHQQKYTPDGYKLLGSLVQKNMTTIRESKKNG